MALAPLPTLSSAALVAVLILPHPGRAEPSDVSAPEAPEAPEAEAAKTIGASQAVATSSDPAPVSASAEGIGAALVPGLVVHGTGLWIRGDRVGAKRLLKLQGLGLGMAVVSGGLLGATGASRRVANKTIPFLVSGTAMFIQTWLADIYGSSGGGRRDATPRLAPVPLALELGAFYVRDKQFDYGPFTRGRASWQLGSFRLSPELAVSLGGNNQRLRATGAYRWWGPSARRSSGDGSYIETELGARSHRYGREEFIASSVEVIGRGRIDGRRLGRSMAGSFADLEVGYGLEATRFETGEMATDVGDTLMVRFAYGLYLGHERSPVRGEVSFYYDHRRDEFAGGLSPLDIGGGFLGYFGLGLDLDIGSRFGVVSSIEAGSALVFSTALKARFGEGAR